MFPKHVMRDLTDYCQNRLSAADATRVSRHLLACERCRRDFECVRAGLKLAQQLRRVQAPAPPWTEIERLLPPAAAEPAKLRGSLGWWLGRRTLVYGAAA